MSLQDVLARVDFNSNVSQDDKNAIVNIITNIYGTPSGQILLEKVATDPIFANLPVFFNKTVGGNNSNYYYNEINYNWSDLSDLKMIDANTGATFTPSPTRAILHELIHVVNQTGENTTEPFNTPGGDYEGSVVPLENEIMNQLGETYSRAGYYSVLRDSEFADIDLQPGASLGDWPFAFAVVDRGYNVIDTSDQDTAVMLVGLGGDDTLNSGNSDDIIYGGSGKDTINAGDGYNNVYGNAGDDIIKAGMHMDELDGGRDNDFIAGGGDQDVLIGGSGHDILIGGDGDKNNLGLSVRHAEWRDSDIDHLIGGTGHDSFYIYGAGQQSGDIHSTIIGGNLEKIYVEDTDLTVYFQFDVENTYASFNISGNILAAAMSSPQENTLGVFSAIVNGEQVQGQVKMSNSVVGGVETIWAQWGGETPKFAGLAFVDLDGLI